MTVRQSEPEQPRAVHVFVDLENNQPTLDEVRALVPDLTDVWLFHSGKQIDRLAEGLRKMGSKAPSRAKAYRQHLKSMLGKDAQDDAVEAAAAALEKLGVAKVDGNAVRYGLASTLAG
jgi:hypothetical protein